jgi:gluconokinase
MVILLMGVAGSGKTTVGRLLAGVLGWHFEDADDYHSPQNIAKMQAGIPLSDEDRQPWLLALHEAIAGWSQAGDNVVLACSALKQAYRDLLITSSEVKLVYLRGSYSLIEDRLASRQGHYAHVDLLRSQLEAVEEPKDGVVIDVSAPPEAIAIEIRRRLQI